MKKLLFAAGFLAIATSAASAQVYVYPNVPYGYGAGYYNYGGPYAPEPYAAAPGFYGFYGFDPTANNGSITAPAHRDADGTPSRPVKLNTAVLRAGSSFAMPARLASASPNKWSQRVCPALSNRLIDDTSISAKAAS